MITRTDGSSLYTLRMNLVFDHIRTHLEDDLSLEALAEIACFSPFHFHRLFKSLTGETVNDCVTRLRLERAVAMLKGAPTMTITEAAFACGFTEAATFSRAFRKQYGITARGWDRRSALKDSKNRQVDDGLPQYTVESLSELEQSGKFPVRLISMPARQFAFIRIVDSYKPGRVIGAYDRLVGWYQQWGEPKSALLIGMSQDDPDVTPPQFCRYDWCLSAPAVCHPSHEIGLREFPAFQAVTVRVQGDIFQVDRAWQYLYRYWLPRSRFQPDNLPAMEIYHRQPLELGWEQHDLDCAVPIVSL
jgi:AraC family transcriptional regulator